MSREVLEARVRMAMTVGLGPILSARLEDALGGAPGVLGATMQQLQGVEGIGVQRAKQIRAGLDEANVAGEWELIERHGVRLIAIEDEEYPRLLKHIHDPPRLLYVRGGIEEHDALSLALVGSRKCTAYGREQADRLAASCAQAGLTIISGGARGIDTSAHRAALRVKRRTIAVLGCGLSQHYPPENEELFNAIAGGGGALVTELPMTAPPIAENFPRRNRLISGMSLGVLVVEAALRSGALITARLAAEEHHREVMAVPGRVDSAVSAGCHRIIREGWANLVTNGADVLDCLGEAGQMLRAVMEESGLSTEAREEKGSRMTIAEAGLSETDRQILRAIGDEESGVDELVASTGLGAAAIGAGLVTLELRGLIMRLGANRVRRR